MRLNALALRITSSLSPGTSLTSAGLPKPSSNFLSFAGVDPIAVRAQLPARLAFGLSIPVSPGKTSSSGPMSLRRVPSNVLRIFLWTFNGMSAHLSNPRAPSTSVAAGLISPDLFIVVIASRYVFISTVRLTPASLISTFGLILPVKFVRVSVALTPRKFSSGSRTPLSVVSHRSVFLFCCVAQSSADLAPGRATCCDWSPLLTKPHLRKSTSSRTQNWLKSDIS